MKKFDTNEFKADLPQFREKCTAFFNGEVDKNAYKGFSGLYGSYAQKGYEKSMLRLRMTAGRVTKEKMAFVAKMIREYQVPRAIFTTCESIQFHDLDVDQTCEIMEKAYDVQIVTMGGGGDFPRNIMCSPLTGTQNGYFNVLPYAQAAGDYLMGFIKAEKMPRKLKVCFSDSPENIPHATFRDLGFVAREDGKFDVYCAGGLGNNPRFGLQVAEAVDPSDILAYIKAMWLTFRAYGNYENRGKARTRYMIEALGGEENYKAAYLEKLAEVRSEGEDLTIHPDPIEIHKMGDGSTAEGKNILPQKQEGLYTVSWHPIGGTMNLDVFCQVSDLVAGMDEAEGRLGPDKTMYIINLTGTEARQIAECIQNDTAQTLFEYSVSCVGATTCQVGLRDSNGMLRACVKAVREAGIPDGALPKIYVSGCPSSCGTHQIGKLGLRGATKRVDNAPQAAFILYAGGNDAQGKEKMGAEVGTILESQVPAFLVELGQTVAASGKDYEAWIKENPNGVAEAAQKYI